MEICETGAGSFAKAGGLFSNMADFPEYSLVAAIFKGQLNAIRSNEMHRVLIGRELSRVLYAAL